LSNKCYAKSGKETDFSNHTRQYYEPTPKKFS